MPLEWLKPKISKMNSTVIFPILLVISMAGCDNKGGISDDLTTNKAPVILSVVAEPETLGIGGTTSIVVNATDPENDPLFYGWRVSLGSIVGNGPTAIWRAPAGSGEYLVSVFVEDDRFAAVNTTIPVWVNDSNSDNSPPVINYITANPDILPSEGIAEIMVGAYDPDGENGQLEFLWGSAAGSFDGEGPNVVWTAPVPSCCPTAYSIWVVVRDPGRATSSVSRSITVIP
ncbi:MAG: hypothetical protein V3W18_10410 [candidate division Zixibacteria bacterium]